MNTLRNVIAAIACSQCIAGAAIGVQREGVYQWRHNSSEKSAHLFAADSDSTDNIGSISFSCVIHSDEITVEAHLSKPSSVNFARLIADDIYPRITFSKAGPSAEGILIDKIMFSEIYGWEYYFVVGDREDVFTKFEKTGSFRFKIGDVYSDGADLKTGLEEIVEFRRLCRKL